MKIRDKRTAVIQCNSNHGLSFKINGENASLDSGEYMLLHAGDLLEFGDILACYVNGLDYTDNGWDSVANKAYIVKAGDVIVSANAP